MIEEHKNRRKASINETGKRRKTQTVAIIKTKIDKDKLNKNTKLILEMNTHTFERLNISPYVKAGTVHETGSLNVLT
jgi:hypothetical protein